MPMRICVKRGRQRRGGPTDTVPVHWHETNGSASQLCAKRGAGRRHSDVARSSSKYVKFLPTATATPSYNFLQQRTARFNVVRGRCQCIAQPRPRVAVQRTVAAIVFMPMRDSGTVALAGTLCHSARGTQPTRSLVRASTHARSARTRSLRPQRAARFEVLRSGAEAVLKRCGRAVGR